MAKVRTLQSALNAGEISPRLLGRPDIPRYQQGLEKLRNAMPLVMGGATRRWGFRYVAAPMSADSWLAPAVLTIDGVQTGFILELGHQKLRFWTAGSQVKTGGGAAYEIATPYTTVELRYVRYEQFENAVYFAHPDHHPQRLTRKGATEWVLENVPFTHYAFLRPKNTENIILTPSDVDGAAITLTSNLDYFVAGHVGVKFEVNGGVIEVTAVTDPRTTTAKVVNAIIPQKKAKIKLSTVTITADPAQMSGTKTLTVTAQSNRNNETLTTTFPNSPPDGFTITMESVPNKDTITVVIDPAQLAGIQTVKVISIIDQQGPDSRLTSTVAPSPRPAGVTVTIKNDTDKLRGTEPDNDWTEQAWSNRLGWPTAVAFREQRLMFANTRTYPTYLWGSKISEVLIFRTGTTDSDSFAWMLAEASTPIEHLTSGGQVLCNTFNREVTVDGGNGPLTATNLKIKSPTEHGIKREVRPVRTGDEILFVSPTGKRLRGFRWKFDKDKYTAPDYAIFAEHLIADGGGIRQAAYAAEPFAALWAVTEAGGLLTFVTDQDQEVMAWAAQDDPAGLTRWKSLAVIPDAAGQGQVWALVERKVGGVWVPCMEYADETLLLDSAVTGTDAVGKNTWGGLGHLEGRAVGIMADGVVISGKTVTGGEIELDYRAKSVEIGLKYQTVFKDLPVGMVLGSGTAQGTVIGLNEIRVKFYQTQAAAINGEALSFRDEWGDALMGPVPVFTGEKIMPELGWGSTPESSQIEITVDDPLPCTVLSIVKKVSIND